MELPSKISNTDILNIDIDSLKQWTLIFKVCVRPIKNKYRLKKQVGACEPLNQALF